MSSITIAATRNLITSVSNLKSGRSAVEISFTKSINVRAPTIVRPDCKIIALFTVDINACSDVNCILMREFIVCIFS
jgi:hypothetical protein